MSKRKYSKKINSPRHWLKENLYENIILKKPDKRWFDVKLPNPKPQDKRLSMAAKDIELPGGIPNNMNI